MMSQSQYSLTWEAHLRNVCDGLSSLQQNGEFVDMTLAADGHMVKVHQVVLALASPYFKDLITSAQCPHPVIFLSKVTHPTLSAILEYIYTGEVLVSLEHLNDLIEAAKELHIKGLKDMNIHSSLTEMAKQQSVPENEAPLEETLEDEDLCMFQVTNEDDDCLGHQEQQEGDEMDNMESYEYESDPLRQHTLDQGIEEEQLIHNTEDLEENQNLDVLEPLQSQDEIFEQEIQDENESQTHMDIQDTDSELSVDHSNIKMNSNTTALQYTVSNRGSLQMILNRFVYYLKHTNRDKSRQWRCVDYLSHTGKCPAHVFTKNDMVIHRIAAHTHPFHDKKIFKKLKNGAVFSAFTEAEKEGKHIMKKKPLDVNVTE